VRAIFVIVLSQGIAPGMEPMAAVVEAVRIMVTAMVVITVKTLIHIENL
jgi:hypothetical protein